MRFNTVQDILSWTRTFHQKLATQYEALRQGHEQQRVGLLLDYLSDHEKKLADAINRYETDAANGLLKTWYDEPVDFSLPKTQSQLKHTLQANDTAEIVNLAIQFHDSLIKTYKAFQEKSPNDSTRALFASLAAMENHEQLRMVRDAQRLEDY